MVLSILLFYQKVRLNERKKRQRNSDSSEFHVYDTGLSQAVQLA